MKIEKMNQKKKDSNEWEKKSRDNSLDSNDSNSRDYYDETNERKKSKEKDKIKKEKNGETKKIMNQKI